MNAALPESLKFASPSTASISPLEDVEDERSGEFEADFRAVQERLRKLEIPVLTEKPVDRYED